MVRSFLQQTHGLSGYDNFFIGIHHIDPDRAAICGQIHAALGSGIFSWIQLYAKEHKDPACFDYFVTRWLGIPRPDRADSWLDGRFSGEARLEFQRYLDEYSGVIMDEDGFVEFSKGFQHKCIEAYGKASNGRDRDDRVWKEKKINNKFEELELPYKIDVNNLDKTYCLLKRKVT